MELKGTKYGQKCILGGYLNTTMGSHEKRGGSIIQDSLHEHMEDLVFTLNLFDVKP